MWKQSGFCFKVFADKHFETNLGWEVKFNVKTIHITFRISFFWNTHYENVSHRSISLDRPLGNIST